MADTSDWFFPITGVLLILAVLIAAIARVTATLQEFVFGVALLLGGSAAFVIVARALFDY